MSVSCYLNSLTCHRFSHLGSILKHLRSYKLNVAWKTPLRSPFTAIFDGEQLITCSVYRTRFIRYTDVLYSFSSLSKELVGHHLVYCRCWPLIWSYHNYPTWWAGCETLTMVSFHLIQGGLHNATAFPSRLQLDSIRLWVARIQILLLCNCSNFLVSFCCLSRHFWLDFSDRLLTDFQWTNSKSTASPLEMTIKHQWNSSRQSQWKSDRHPMDSVTIIVIIII